ncbi:hypothetical protein SAMN04487830_1485 [Pseudobutyrivibrio sp. OR37]|uniref:hypothetical protein n=1 Tax=Pseudobutyrivibrio sp. OR37 TaxID=1798186 RepID=UPI0008F1BE37|nr:hypothetical protein [Pseudobutyrivibrio sp. OR37]SFI35733.1 hypothetical protein SAMN04487830_1485 [Pseudobutyrivibrio sp. OR37]
MVEFIHSLTGSKMLVAEDRVEEYKAAGHKLAAKNSKANKKESAKETKAQTEESNEPAEEAEENTEE